MNHVFIGKQNNMMTKKLQTWTWWIRYDNLTHIPRQWRHSEPRNGEKKTYNHTPWQTLYTLHWLKSVILPLINTNIWQKLINRSFAMLIYQAEIVGPPSIFRSIIHLSIQPTHNSLQEDAHSWISQFLLARALGSNVFYDLW